MPTWYVDEILMPAGLTVWRGQAPVVAIDEAGDEADNFTITVVDRNGASFAFGSGEADNFTITVVDRNGASFAFGSGECDANGLVRVTANMPAFATIGQGAKFHAHNDTQSTSFDSPTFTLHRCRRAMVLRRR